MIEKIDGANVIMISEKGYSHDIPILGTYDVIKIYYLAICQYDNDNGIYLFSCDENMEVEGDTLFDNIQEAIECAESWSNAPIKWRHILDGENL